MPHAKLVIAGGGIAAEAMALAFGKAGRDVLVIGHGGNNKGGLQLAPNGWAALDALGITAQSLTAIALPLAALRLVALETGITLTAIELNASKNRRPYTAILRAGLTNALATAGDATGHITRRKARVAKITPRDKSITLTLDDGEVIEADWLIGCDGAGGIARDFVEAGATRRPLHIRTALRAVIDESTAKSNPGGRDPGGRIPGGRAVTLWLGNRGGGHIVHYPLCDGTQNLIAVTPPLVGDAAREAARGMLLRQNLLAPLADSMATAHAIAVMDYGFLDTWQRGRVVLAGDAAHPMPPHLAQGAGQSLVDAASLHRHLMESGDDDMQDIVTRWSAMRIRALRPVVRDAGRAGAVFALGSHRAKAELRNLALGSVGGIALGRVLDNLWRA